MGSCHSPLCTESEEGVSAGGDVRREGGGGREKATKGEGVRGGGTLLPMEYVCIHVGCEGTKVKLKC